MTSLPPPPRMGIVDKSRSLRIFILLFIGIKERKDCDFSLP